MQDLAVLAAFYGEIDTWLEAQRTHALASGDQAKVDRIETKQRLNDQAYFVLCWGQLELEIDNACPEAIRQRKADPNWTVRRAWDLYNPDDKRLSGLSLEDRVALVLDRSSGSGSRYARVMNFYALRNQIAHGKLRPDRIDVTAVVAEFHQIQSALTR